MRDSDNGRTPGYGTSLRFSFGSALDVFEGFPGTDTREGVSPCWMQSRRGCSRAARIARETQDLVEVGDEASSGSDIEEDEIAATERIPPMEPVERELRETMDPACYRNCRQHRISGVVHQLIDADAFYCGRRMSDRYVAPTFPQEESTCRPFVCNARLLKCSRE